MILVDIGNTSLHFGITKKNKIIDDFRLEHKLCTLKKLNSIIKKYPNHEIIVCSVVPKLTKIFSSLKEEVFLVGKNIKVPIKSLYNPREIGQDRLVTAYAAKSLYPDTRIVIDFGTAITIDFLSKNGEYAGGFILPGIKLYLNSLATCALLPNNLFLIKKTSGIPKDTKTSISMGVIEGFSSMLNGFIKKHRKLHNVKKGKIVITGGDSVLVKENLDFLYVYEPLICLKGLLLLASSKKSQ